LPARSAGLIKEHKRKNKQNKTKQNKQNKQNKTKQNKQNKTNKTNKTKQTKQTKQNKQNKQAPEPQSCLLCAEVLVRTEWVDPATRELVEKKERWVPLTAAKHKGQQPLTFYFNGEKARRASRESRLPSVKTQRQPRRPEPHTPKTQQRALVAVTVGESLTRSRIHLQSRLPHGTVHSAACSRLTCPSALSIVSPASAWHTSALSGNCSGLF
jgi:hypothetical protein